MHCLDLSGRGHFAPVYSELRTCDRVFGMTFSPGHLSFRTPRLFSFISEDRNEHLLPEIVIKKWCEMSVSRFVSTFSTLLRTPATYRIVVRRKKRTYFQHRSYIYNQWDGGKRNNRWCWYAFSKYVIEAAEKEESKQWHCITANLICDPNIFYYQENYLSSLLLI